jgi:hypothetical protein
VVRLRAGIAGAGVAFGIIGVIGLGTLTGLSVSPATANGVGNASWTPSSAETTAYPSDLLVPGDSLTVRTVKVWPREQVEGLGRYVAAGLRYTHEVNDRSGRLSATGYWATNLPDPAFDRDDDDGDGRWEEAEITAGAELPKAGRPYTALVQLSRWREVQRRKRCDRAWDLRAGEMEVLSQLSRELLGEWQAERYTLAYDRVRYGRSDPRPDLPADAPEPDCGPAGDQGEGTTDLVVTFARPIGWDELLEMGGERLPWSAYEAIGSHPDDDLLWTCGGPTAGRDRDGLQACRTFSVEAEGVVAAGGHFTDAEAARVRVDERVIRVREWHDSLPTWVAQLAGIEVEPPDLTLDDAYWSLVLGR